MLPARVFLGNQCPAGGVKSTRRSVEFYSGDRKKLVDEILAPRYGNIRLVGGAMLCNSGIERRWRLKNVVAYKTGVVELLYRGQSTSSQP